MACNCGHCHVSAQDLEKAISEWYKTGHQDFGPLFDVLEECLHHDVDIILPIQFDPKALGTLNPETLTPKDIFEKDIPFAPQVIENENGEKAMVAFTSLEIAPCTPSVSNVAFSFAFFLQMILMEERLSGALINPVGETLFLPKEFLETLWSTSHPKTEADNLLDAGVEAYNNADYETAFNLYSQSAELGNVTAMSNLGYCYYYGRSVSVDKKMAQLCWEKAAVLGDICATYKLGDMYQNGDLPKDLTFAKAFYRKAFDLADANKDLFSYPDACLRILKYCKDDCDEITYALLANDAVNAFKIRIERGDTHSDNVYKQAQDIYDSIPVDVMKQALASLEK